jgi:SAM-dependent methyltransferase
MEGTFGRYQFDLMVFSGVLYHLMSPLEYLLHCRRLVRPGGLILVETCYDPSSAEMSLAFNMGMDEPAFPEPTTYFLPSEPALLALLRSASFDCLGTVRLAGGSKRITALARAERPSAVRHKTELQRKHDAYCDKPDHFAYGDLFYDLEHTEVARSAARYSGPLDRAEALEIRAYRPTIPLQPAWSPPAR